MTLSINELSLTSKVKAVVDEVHKVVKGHDEAVLFCVFALLSGQHILTQSPPGLGKTTMVRTIGKVIDGLIWGRVQATAELMAAGITGAEIFDQRLNDFRVFPGILTLVNFLLVDEFNRMNGQTSSALLEAMQEHQVTINSKTYPTMSPFTVFATQNPSGSEGTFFLPPPLLDRFGAFLYMNDVSVENEMEMLREPANFSETARRANPIEISPTLTITELQNMQNDIVAVYRNTDERVLRYTVEAIRALRPESDEFKKVFGDRAQYWQKLIDPGTHASPRGQGAVQLFAATIAYACGKDHIGEEDVRLVFKPAARHRISLTRFALREGVTADAMIDEVLATLPIDGASHLHQLQPKRTFQDIFRRKGHKLASGG